MKVQQCKKCGYDLDSVDHHLNCNVPEKTWTTTRGKKAREWD